MNMPHKDAPHW